LLIGVNSLNMALIKKITACGGVYAHINTEVIRNNMRNFNPKKTNFMGAYPPLMKQGGFFWDGLVDNTSKYER
jgi:hypothetical protein